MKTIIEPFRIKTVEPIRMTTAQERETLLERAGYNLFQIPSDAVIVDLLTDSGTGAMSAAQWGALLRGDESYAGSPSFFRLRDVVADLFGFPSILPVHQGRAAERILFGVIGGLGMVIPGNTHFDTTRANIEASGARALDFPVREGLDPEDGSPFKGNVDLEGLARCIDEHGSARVPCVLITITNNALGGQPVSLDNLRAARSICHAAGIPLYLDAARYAENAFLARERDPALAALTLREVVRAYLDMADGFLLSAKKDALSNTGGLLGLRDEKLLSRCRAVLVLTEGFPTYGGLAGRDLEALAQGMEESTDADYLAYRAAITRYMGRTLDAERIPYVHPPGMHAIYLDAGRFLPQIPASELPAQALAIELYRVAGIRTCEVGTLLRGDGHGGPELLRMAIPRRVYTQSHIDYVLEALAIVKERRHEIRGLRIAASEPALRHFTARFAQAETVARAT
ncbi:MAG: tryptophanase [Acidobacteriota bacterium]